MSENTKSEREVIQDLITLSESEFEKKITYVGAGALLLSLTLIEKIIDISISTVKTLLVLGWISLVFSLLINLVSHMVSKIFLRREIDDIDNSIDIKIRKENYKRRLQIIEFINWIAIGSLIVGIILIIIFSSLNTFHPVLSPKTSNITGDTLNIKIIN